MIHYHNVFTDSGNTGAQVYTCTCVHAYDANTSESIVLCFVTCSTHTHDILYIYIYD